MPRSSNNKSSQTKQNIPAPSTSHVPLPSPLHVPLPSASHGPSMVDSMKQGFGFGIGSAIARNLFNTNNKDENTKKMRLRMNLN